MEDDLSRETDEPASLRTIRLFIALETSEAMLKTIMLVQRSIQQRGDLPVRWVVPQQAHLTLQFLGDVVTSRVPALAHAIVPAVARHPALLLHAGEVGAFPSVDAPRVVWLGVRGNDKGVMALQREVADAVRGVTEFGTDRTPFRPHLTLGRVRADRRDKLGMAAVAAVLARPVAVLPAAWTVREVALIRSVLGPTGPRYTTLERFPLHDGEQTR